MNWYKPFSSFLFFLFLILKSNTGGLHAISRPPLLLEDTLKVSTFDVDATPPEGTWLAYDSLLNTWDLSLRAKGIVLTGAGKPIVLCVVDWIGIANEGHDAFREAMAKAAGTTIERVAVHTLHQHDAPTCDFGAEKVLKQKGMNPLGFESTFHREVIRRLSFAIKNSMKKSRVVTHVGLGRANVDSVASNRRLVGDDGKIMFQRTSATRDPNMRAKPEGLIDPEVSLISLWNKNTPLVLLTYYATHPQSYYRTGVSNPDIPGVARFLRQLAIPDALNIHFNGASGNITVGKYNDGAHVNRYVLAQRLEDGMKKAWASTVKTPVTAADVGWAVEKMKLPAKPDLYKIEEMLKTETTPFVANNTSKLVWSGRVSAGKKIDLTCLTIGKAKIVHLPGEPFIEFQLAAKKMRPDMFVAVAGYGDYAPGYICTAEAYKEGGYEPGMASAVTAGAEKVMMEAIRKVLQ